MPCLGGCSDRVPFGYLKSTGSSAEERGWRTAGRGRARFAAALCRSEAGRTPGKRPSAQALPGPSGLPLTARPSHPASGLSIENMRGREISFA